MYFRVVDVEWKRFGTTDESSVTVDVTSLFCDDGHEWRRGDVRDSRETEGRRGESVGGGGGGGDGGESGGEVGG